MYEFQTIWMILRKPLNLAREFCQSKMTIHSNFVYENSDKATRLPGLRLKTDPCIEDFR